LLWEEAGKASDADAGPKSVLYIQSLNQMIDIHAVRVQAGLRSRISLSIWAGLIAPAILSMASVGYQAGLSATRRSPIMLVLVLAFGGVLCTIADLDRAHEGFRPDNQGPMLDLQASMKVQ
jgi:hypothetical protein